MANQVKNFQQITTGNQVSLQQQIDNMQTVIDRVDNSVKDNMNKLANENIKLREELENLVEYIRKKTEDNIEKGSYTESN